MKVAVSIPDPVFAQAERLSQELGTSRSQLYARALDHFLAAHVPDRLTQAWNQVIDEVEAEPDEFAKAAARQALARLDW